jgi:glucose-1-phosphate thymidylyltransferase
VSVAGKPILGHVLDSIVPIGPEQVIFITGYLGNQIREYVAHTYCFGASYVHQPEMRGQAHAISLARDLVQGPILIAFADTIFDADFSVLSGTDVDGVVFVKEVETPDAFGVVELDGNRIRRIIEKPIRPPTNLAVAGVYYFRDPSHLFQAIERLMAMEMQIRGEYYLADAIQIMIDEGARIEAATIDLWLDCGRPDTLLETNRILLSRKETHVTGLIEQGNVIIPPVVIAPSARVERAVIGPYASIGEHVTITDAIVRDTIVNRESTIANVMLSHSIIGSGAVVRGDFHQMNVGDTSDVSFCGTCTRDTVVR